MLPMADGMDKEEEFVVLSKVRAGHKREFEFALKSQNEVAASLGRTRARKRTSGVAETVGLSRSLGPKPRSNREVGLRAVMDGVDDGGAKSKVERLQDEEPGMRKIQLEEKLGMENEEEPKSDVVDVMSDDENKSRSVESQKKDIENNAEEIIMVGGTDDDKKDYLVVEDTNVDGTLSLRVEDASCFFGKRLSERAAAGVVLQERAVKRLSSLNASEPCLKEMETSEQDNGDKPTSAVVADVGNFSKKVSIKMIPTHLKDLLETGLLEGLPVRYIRSHKTRAPNDAGLKGVINGSGILCYCDECKGTKVVTPNQYELHAGSSNKRPPDYIYLENGSTLRHVLNACKGVDLDALEGVVKNASGCFSEKSSTFCVNGKGSISEDILGRKVLLCDSSTELKLTKATPTQSKNKCDDSTLEEVDVAKRASSGTEKLRASGIKSHGRVTRKDLRLHKLVFKDDVLPDGTEVGYYARGKKLISGYKKGLGIFCLCCQKEVSPSQFEAHAGWASRRQPYLHIYTSNGVSLHELAVSHSRSREPSVDEHDDLCGICFDAGELLCCDGCVRAFHAECISIQSIPPGKWYCRYCTNMFEKQKLSKHKADAIAAGGVTGVDSIKPITKRCIRITKILHSDVSCCVLCRAHDFSISSFGPRTVLICDQCEKEHHVGCLQSHGIQDLKELPEGKWFCSTDCNRIHSALQQLIEVGEQELPDSLLDVRKKRLVEKGLDYANFQIRWRILSGEFSFVDETRLLLSKAVSVLHEQFEQLLEPQSTQDLIPHMVYGREVKDWKLGGMRCAILSVNSIVVSAAVFRIFGKEVAEIPLVATSSDFQGKGYFHSLYACIETLLRDLEVKNLLLPASAEARSLWINKFGFSEIRQDEFNALCESYNIMRLDGASMLHKLVPRL
ncbi:hypothetical protein Dimus_019920 [Dionaea muscipula]